MLAVGKPFNLESTVTAGIVSAKGRSIDIREGPDRIESFIQTDAAVNPGNSGGALVNTQGMLIGINTAIITRSGLYEGYSFAVPSNLVLKVINDLKDYGTVQRGLLGVYIDDMNDERARETGASTIEGVYITGVTRGSGADDAGLRKSDVIIAINGVKTKTLPEMQEQVGRYRPGDTLLITFLRKGKTLSADVTLKNKMNSTALIAARSEEMLDELGIELRDLRPDEVSRFGTKGVRVERILPGSRMEQINMEVGYIITGIGEKPIENVSELVEELRGAEGLVQLKGIYEEYTNEYLYQFEME